ncbi:MAG: hypothetical protein JRN39_05740 [Nitrososphaerota archaeon]|nr:hypothetical protein [Nitrososphaerota archaeon]
MLSEQKKLKVHVKLDAFETDIEGLPDEVGLEFNRLLAKVVPTYDLAKKILLSYGLNDMVTKFGAYVRITPEGPRVLPEKQLSDKFLIALQLVAVKISAESGRQSTHRVTLQELERTTGLNPKSISSRLSELVKAGQVERVVVDDGTYYFITTMGMEWLERQLGKK